MSFCSQNNGPEYILHQHQQLCKGHILGVQIKRHVPNGFPDSGGPLFLCQEYEEVCHRVCVTALISLVLQIITAEDSLLPVCKLLVSCPAYFSHREGKNSLVNGLFRSCFMQFKIGDATPMLSPCTIT